MHRLQRSEHLVCHAPHQPQIIHWTHNEVLTWNGKINSASIVIFFKMYLSLNGLFTGKVSAHFQDPLKPALCTEASSIHDAVVGCVCPGAVFLA